MTTASTVTVLLVLLGGAVGAPARYLVDRWVQTWTGGAFPWGTWVVNVAGCLLLGFVTAGAIAGAVPEPVMAGVGFGFCGALTTYSTFGFETVRLLEDGRYGRAAGNVVSSLAVGLAAAFTGAAAAAALW